MYHGLNNDFLYSAYKLETYFLGKDNIEISPMRRGTCFFVVDKNNKPVLITNRHMIDPFYNKKDKDLESKKYDITPFKIIISGIFKDKENMPTINKVFRVATCNQSFHSNYNNDVIALNNLGLYTVMPDDISHEPILSLDKNEIEFFIPYDFLANKEDFNTQFSICDFVAYPGFPDQEDNKRPIIKTGTISSDPRFNYKFKDEIMGDCVAYEAFSFDGFSGSPVFALQKGIRVYPPLINTGFRDVKLIGVNAGHILTNTKTQNNVHSGISYFYKSTTILDLID